MMNRCPLKSEVDTYMAENGPETFGVTRLDRRGRRRYDPEWKALLVSACLEPGASVAQLALEHGINANLLWKWIQKHKGSDLTVPDPVPTCAPAFIRADVAGVIEDLALPHDDGRALNLRSDKPAMPLSEPARPVLLSTPARMSVSLPNGVNLTVECGDVQAVTAIIEAVRDVQIGR